MPEQRKEQKMLDKISIYIPHKKADKNVMERLRKLGEKRDRTINYLTVQAIIEYLD